jgi:hypothetical protein
MLRGIRDAFNNNLGSNTTYIANKYPKNAQVIISNGTINIKEFEIHKDGVLKLKLESGTIDEQFEVPSGSYHKKERYNARDHLTIITNDNKVVCKNYTMPANQSYIVSKNGELKRSKYGGSIWEEE